MIGDGTGAVSVTLEGDGGATWTLIGPFRDATATYEWHIAAAGHLSSWSAELIEVTPSVEDTSFVTSHRTDFTPLAAPEPIEAPAIDSPPDPASLGMPPDFPLQERSEP